jgi:hypothetical protein
VQAHAITWTKRAVRVRFGVPPHQHEVWVWAGAVERPRVLIPRWIVLRSPDFGSDACGHRYLLGVSTCRREELVKTLGITCLSKFPGLDDDQRTG